MRKVEFRKTVSRAKWTQSAHILTRLCLPETSLNRAESLGAPSSSLPHSLPQRQVCGLAGSCQD